MQKVILSQVAEVDFRDFKNVLQVCNSEGCSVGLFLPIDRYKKLLATLEIPYSPEELERRRVEKGGSSLQSFWNRMGQS